MIGISKDRFYEDVGCANELRKFRTKLTVCKEYTLMRFATSMDMEGREGGFAPFKAKLLYKYPRYAVFEVYADTGSFRESYQYFDLYRGVLKK